jgi:hypothetical protein
MCDHVYVANEPLNHTKVQQGSSGPPKIVATHIMLRDLLTQKCVNKKGY